MNEREEELQENVPKIILYCLNKAENFVQKERYFKSFLFGILTIIVGFSIAAFFHFRKILIIGTLSIIIFYLLIWYFGV